MSNYRETDKNLLGERKGYEPAAPPAQGEPPPLTLDSLIEQYPEPQGEGLTPEREAEIRSLSVKLGPNARIVEGDMLYCRDLRYLLAELDRLRQQLAEAQRKRAVF